MINESVILVFSFIFGTIVGSFLNVVIVRYNSGVSLGGRSMCFSCGKTLAFFELIPLFSFLFLRGKCFKCKSKISFQYFFVELATGVLFLYFFYKYLTSAEALSAFWLIANLIIWSFLVVIFVYDLKHKIIPDLFALFFSIFSFLLIFESCFGVCALENFWPKIIAAVGFFLFFFILWYFSSGQWVGFGDAKLAFGMGLYLGPTMGLSALALGFWIGAAFGVALLGISKLSSSKKTITMKTAIPFAPFLIVGTLLALVFEADIFSVSNIQSLF